TVTFQDDGTHTGTFNLDQNSRLYFEGAGTYTFQNKADGSNPGGITGLGQVFVDTMGTKLTNNATKLTIQNLTLQSGAILDGTGETVVTALNWTDANMEGTGTTTIPVGGRLNILALPPGMVQRNLDTRKLLILGGLNWSG